MDALSPLDLPRWIAEARKILDAFNGPTPGPYTVVVADATGKELAFKSGEEKALHAGRPVLNPVETAVVEVLASLEPDEIITGPEVARRAGYPYEANLKATLAGLRRRQIIGNKAPGYFLKRRPD